MNGQYTPPMNAAWVLEKCQSTARVRSSHSAGGKHGGESFDCAKQQVDVLRTCALRPSAILTPLNGLDNTIGQMTHAWKSPSKQRRPVHVNFLQASQLCEHSAYLHATLSKSALS